MRRTHLKIKIINLADEQRTIRKEVHKFGRQIAAITAEKGEDDYLALAGLRCAQGSVFWHGHEVVRPAARQALLAYGFLRGTPYRRIEQKTNDAPDFDSIRKMARRFYEGEGFETEWGAWLDKANEHLAGNLLLVA